MISIIERDRFEICTSETDDSLPLRPNWILLRELRFGLSTSTALQRRPRVSDNDRWRRGQQDKQEEQNVRLRRREEAEEEEDASNKTKEEEQKRRF